MPRCPHLFIPDRFRLARRIAGLTLLCAASAFLTPSAAFSDEVPLGGNPEDRAPLPATQSEPQQGTCFSVWYRRGAPHNPTNYSFPCYPNNCDPQVPPDGGRLFPKVRAVYVWINAEITPANALLRGGRPEDHYYGWSACPFSNSRDRTRSTGGWSPKTQQFRCRPLDRLRPIPGRQIEFDLQAGRLPTETVTWEGVDYKLMTNGQAGSDDCFAIFTGMTSPLVVDLAGKGLKFTKPGEHVEYDLGEGRTPTVWLANSADAPFLALDLDKNGKIDDVRELFGNATPGPDNKGARDGFETLGKYDENHDKLIDQKDAVFASLFLWADKNVNGVTDDGELRALSSVGIASISLDAKTAFEFQDNFGNLSNLRSSASKIDGAKVNVYDVWFAPADPLGLKGASNAQVSPQSLPKEGTKEHAAILPNWKKAIEQANFGESEMPYDLGEVQTYLGPDGNPIRHVITWTHVFDSCRVQGTFNGDFSVMEKSAGSCS